jgi:hypothetical protein
MAAKSIINELYQRLRTAAPVYCTAKAGEPQGHAGAGFLCSLTLPAVECEWDALAEDRRFEGAGSSKKVGARRHAQRSEAQRSAASTHMLIACASCPITRGARAGVRAAGGGARRGTRCAGVPDGGAGAAPRRADWLAGQQGHGRRGVCVRVGVVRHQRREPAGRGQQAPQEHR